MATAEMEIERQALTPRQREVLDCIRRFIDRKGYAPSLDDLADALHVVSKNGVLSLLKPLERKGYIRRDRNVSRGLVVLEPASPPHADGRDELREALRMVLDNGKPVPSAEPDEGDVGLSVYLPKEDWDRLKALAGEGTR